MRAAIVAVLVAAAVPAAACPFRPRVQVDPVVALEERIAEEGADAAAIADSAGSLARKRSQPASRRAHALSVKAVALRKLGETRAATRTLSRALALDAETARAAVTRGGGEELLAAAETLAKRNVART